MTKKQTRNERMNKFIDWVYEYSQIADNFSLILEVEGQVEDDIFVVRTLPAKILGTFLALWITVRVTKMSWRRRQRVKKMVQKSVIITCAENFYYLSS